MIQKGRTRGTYYVPAGSLEESIEDEKHKLTFQAIAETTTPRAVITTPPGETTTPRAVITTLLPKDLINDLDSFGLIFEDMAVRDLRVFAEALDGKLYHYRDSSGLECDTVLHRRNGTYGLIEVKLGGEKLINDGADALNTLANTIDTTKMKKPSFKMVLTAVGPYAYQRPDGIFVVPIGCLKD
jgi:hypothetical protein